MWNGCELDAAVLSSHSILKILYNIFGILFTKPLKLIYYQVILFQTGKSYENKHLVKAKVSSFYHPFIFLINAKTTFFEFQFDHFMFIQIEQSFTF